MSRILLIEDNPANLELMRYLLSACGFELEMATDGQTGLTLAQSGGFDLIVCDIQLPELDGYEIARRLSLDPGTPKVPLIAVTALAMVGDRERILAAGFNDYISKPIDPESFLEQIRSTLGGTQRIATDRGTSPRAASAGDVSTRDVKTIVVVDDLPVHLELARSILEPHGYRVLTASGPQDGFALANSNPCDLILSDVWMGSGTGFELLKLVKANDRLKEIPFIFLTSTGLTAREREMGLALGAMRYLIRPIEPDQLLAEIESCLREAKRIARGNDSDCR